jgi:hypothetical protein
MEAPKQSTKNPINKVIDKLIALINFVTEPKLTIVKKYQEGKKATDNQINAIKGWNNKQGE